MKPDDPHRLAKRLTTNGFNRGFIQAFTGLWFPWAELRRERAAKPAMMAWLCTTAGIRALGIRYRLPF